jgi:hypothetical protein
MSNAAATLVISTVMTLLLLAIMPGFGGLPGDFVYDAEGVRVMIPFVSGALVLLASYGLVRGTGDVLARVRR